MRWRNLLSQAFVCALAAALCPSASAVSSEAAKIELPGVTIGTTIAPPARIAAATPITGLQGPISKNEPNQCEGLTAPAVESLGGVREGGGAAVSPGDIELERLAPGTDYVACISILNFETKGAPLEGRLDDVDIVASDSPAGGINVLDQSTGVGTWVIPSTRSFSVPPGSRMKIPYIVHTPEILPAGTLVGGVAARFLGNSPIAAVVTQRVYVSGEGGQHRRLDISRIHSSRLLGRGSREDFNASFDAHNRSDYVESFVVGVKMTGLGRTVRNAKATNGSLLPDGKMRLTAKVEDLPWIGIFRPTLKVEERNGTQEIKLPWVLVLPPWPFVIALILAILFPIVYLLRRWWLNRQEWMQYLDDEDWDDEDEYDEDLHAYQ
jgi:hypothetical protein